MVSGGLVSDACCEPAWQIGCLGNMLGLTLLCLYDICASGPTMDIVEMVLGGRVNKSLVRYKQQGTGWH